MQKKTFTADQIISAYGIKPKAASAEPVQEQSSLRKAIAERGQKFQDIQQADFGGNDAYNATARVARQIPNLLGGVYDVAKAAPVVGGVIKGVENITGGIVKKGIELAAETPTARALKLTADKVLEQIPNEQKEAVKTKVQGVLEMPNVQEAMTALGDITAGLGVLEGASVLPGIGKSVGKGTAKVATGLIDNVQAKRIAKTASDVDGLVGSVVQGKPADIAKAKKALQSINIEGVKTYEDLRGRFDEKISDISTKLDETLSTKTDKKPLQELGMKLKVGNSEVSHNYVDDALSQLDELYTKTNDPVGAEEVRQLRAKAESEGLTVKEINDIARKHGNEFSTKAFNKTGDPLTSVNAQAFENTRTGIKNTARELFGDDAFKVADAEVSNLIRSRDLAEKMTVEVNKLRQRIQERGLLEKLGRGAFEVFDMFTGKAASGFLRAALVPRGGGLKTLNALDLEKNLAKTLAKIKSVPLDGSADDITKALESIIKGQSSPSSQDLTPGNTLKTKSSPNTPQTSSKTENITNSVTPQQASVKPKGDVLPGFVSIMGETKDVSRMVNKTNPYSKIASGLDSTDRGWINKFISAYDNKTPITKELISKIDNLLEAMNSSSKNKIFNPNGTDLSKAKQLKLLLDADRELTKKVIKKTTK